MIICDNHICVLTFRSELNLIILLSNGTTLARLCQILSRIIVDPVMQVILSGCQMQRPEN
jgi:hypothetical protein